jgi:serine/threonine protein kinase
MMRRIWYELCKAVGWMHGVGLVRRDIKLESVYHFLIASYTSLICFMLDTVLATTAFTNLVPGSSHHHPCQLWSLTLRRDPRNNG